MPDREISFLLALLRGISGGNLEWEQEKEHFYNTFKRVFGISELEQKIDFLNADWNQLEGKIEKLERLVNSQQDLLNNMGTVQDFNNIIKRIEKLEEASNIRSNQIGDLDTEISELKEYIDEHIKEIHIRSHNQAHKIEEVLRDDITKAFDLILKHDIEIGRNDNTFFGDGFFHDALAKCRNNIFRKLSGEQEQTDEKPNSIDYKQKYEDCMKSKINVSKVPEYWVKEIFPELDKKTLMKYIVNAIIRIIAT